MPERADKAAALQKITVHVPTVLLKRARRASGSGITETVRQGLHLVATHDAYGNSTRFAARFVSISI